ncbi:MAG: ATP-grasp domain-containing protein [Candidatus Pacearchaeota archaeon]
MRINVLVTSGGSAISQGIIKSLKASNLEKRIVVTDAQPYSAGLYRGDVAYLVPLAKDSNYIESIIEICKRERIQAILIGMDYELLPLSKNRARIEYETGAKVIVSSPEIIRISDDKFLTYNFLKNNNFPIIPSALYKDVDLLIKEEGFPLIIKPRIGDSSKNTFIVQNKKDLEEKIDFFLKNSELNPWLSKKVDPIIQKYIGTQNDEFTSTTIVFDRKSYGVISMQREMKYGGHTTKALIKQFPEINEQIKKVAEKLNPFGPCNFQSRIINGVPYIFEINARFSGTTPTCALAGFNHVEACLRKVVFGEELQPLRYREGVMLRYFNEVFVSIEEIEKLKNEKKIKNPKSEVNMNF